MEESHLVTDIHALAYGFVRFGIYEPCRVISCVVAWSFLFDCIQDRQCDDPHLLIFWDTILWSGSKELVLGYDGVLQPQVGFVFLVLMDRGS